MGYRDQCREMKNDFVVGHEATDESRIADVATDEIDFLSDRLRQIVQPTIAVEGIVLSKSGNFGSRRNKSFCQVRTNETVRACYEDLGTKVAHSHRCPPHFLVSFDWPPRVVSIRDPAAIVQAPRRIQPRSE